MCHPRDTGFESYKFNGIISAVKRLKRRRCLQDDTSFESYPFNERVYAVKRLVHFDGMAFEIEKTRLEGLRRLPDMLSTLVALEPPFTRSHLCRSCTRAGSQIALFLWRFCRFCGFRCSLFALCWVWP